MAKPNTTRRLADDELPGVLYDATRTAETVKAHGEAIENIKDKLQMSEGFAEMFIRHVENSKPLSDFLKAKIGDEFSKSDEARKAIERYVVEMDRSRAKALFRSFGLMIWSAVIFTLGAIVQALVAKLLH